MKFRLLLFITYIITSTMTFLSAMEQETNHTDDDPTAEDFVEGIEDLCKNMPVAEITLFIADELKNESPFTEGITDDENPLYWAVIKGYTNAVKVLIDAIFIRQRDAGSKHSVYDLVRYAFSEEKNTVLHIAVCYKFLKIVAIILGVLPREYACNLITLPNANGQIPFSCATGSILDLFEKYIDDTVKIEDLIILIQRLRIG